MRVRLLAFSLGLCVLLAVCPTVSAQPTPPAHKEMPVSFLNDVIPVLTRMGCNQGACHGKNAGQNGFKLSLRGYAPEWDHEWLTKEYAGRRINLSAPEASLLLQKPAGETMHAGGKLFDEHHRAYQVLLLWIREGAPGPLKDEAKVQKLEIQPGALTLKVNEERQLLVRAQYSNNELRDVTWLARFDSNDASVADVSADGKVRILRSGETAIRVTFQGLVSVVMVASPYDQKVPAELFAQKNNLIDEHLFKKLHALNIPPSGLCTDDEFMRRVYLDTTGMLPTAAEVKAFRADQTPNKRARLIDALLERPEYVDYWALKLGDLFQNRKESDHDVRGAKGVRSFHQWLHQQVATNRPWDALARDVLTAKGDTHTNPAVGYYIVTVGEKQDAHHSPVVAAVAQTFLGTRIGCAQCHNHPLEKYTQDDYYHFAAYFSQVKFKRQEPQKGPTLLKLGTGNPQQDKQPIGVTQPRTGEFMKPQPLDRTETKLNPGEDPRDTLAKWITDPKNEYFAGAMVNRLWAHFFHTGLVEPVDDLRASNPPTNPALWNALVKEFVASKYNLKHMVKLLLNSRAYQLSAKTKPGNKLDNRFYSHYYARRLPAEVLLDAVAQSTGVPDQFPGYPLGIRAVQVPDPAVKSYFLKVFGRPERLTACACERNDEVTLPQLLHMQVGDTVENKLRSGQGTLAKWLKEKKSIEEVVELIFLTCLGRTPNMKETATIQQSLQQGSREEVLRDLFWAVLNTKEFAFNH
jgi:hypothetical protein